MKLLTIPALQRDASRACVACGAPADSYCAQCKLTPYCSQQCQRKDWADRHRGVCHNLARMNRRSEPLVHATPEAEVPEIPAAAPLRPPHSTMNKREPARDDDKMQKPFNNKYNNKQDYKPAGSNNNTNIGNCNLGQGDRKPYQRNQSLGNDQDEQWGKKDIKPTPPTTPQPQPKNEEVKPKPAPVQPQPQLQEQPNKPAAVNGVKPPGSVNDVVPVRKIVPKNYLIELVSIGDSVLLSVDANAADCCTTEPGFICLSMNDKFGADFQALCEVYVVDCEADKDDFVPKPGDAFSYFNTEDGGWYRGRCLSSSLAALLDSSKIVPLTAGDKLKKLPPKYKAMPEFCCLLNGKVKLGDNLKCTLLTQTADGYKVTLENVETGVSIGEGEVSRWLPTVEYPKPAVAIPNAAPAIAEVPRPPVMHSSAVLLVDATDFDRVFVRPAATASQRKFDGVLQDVIQYGMTATPLKEPPSKNQIVIGKFTDGFHYRAMCKRTNVKQNKYLLEYIEYGNVEIVPLENLYACPPHLDLSAIPTEASLVTLQGNSKSALTSPAVKYIEMLKDSNAELILTIPSGANTSPSGSAVTLTVVKTNECMNAKLELMCTPDWKKLEERGGDVVETTPLMFSDIESLELPASGCTLDVLDVSALEAGSVSACQSGLALTDGLELLTKQMAEYCNSEIGKEPYLPKHEEVCIARFPPYTQWFRAVLLEQIPGSTIAKVLYLDYGNVEDIPVNMLRKMLPEFVRGHPALAAQLEVKDFPKNVTPDMLACAVEHMQINDEGRGTLLVTRCEKQEDGTYIVEAPALLKAMRR